jgi:hypothetical protein
VAGTTPSSGETIDLTAGTAIGGDGSDTLHNIANVIGSPFADMVIGNVEANNIDPGAGTATDRTLAFALRAAHAQRVLRQKGLVLKVACPDEACTAIVGTTGSLKGLRTGIHPATKRITAGTVQTIKVRLTGAQLRTLRAALRAHKRATLKVTVNAVDAAGNVVTRTLRVKVKR